MRKARRDLRGELRGVVGDLDVEHADEPLALAVKRDPGGADLLAEDRDRAVGQRVHVGNLGIAHDHIDEGRVGAHVFGLADRDVDRGGAPWRRELDKALRCRLVNRQCGGGDGSRRCHEAECRDPA